MSPQILQGWFRKCALGKIVLGGALLLLPLTNRADVVLDWNDALLHAMRAENAAPTGGSRAAAMVHAAIYDAVNSILRTHEPYLFLEPAAPGASAEAAAVAAAYHTLFVLCPTRQAAFNELYTNHLNRLGTTSGVSEGLRIGRAIAVGMLEHRVADGSTTQIPYIPSDAPGAWRRTAPDFRPPLDPHWGGVVPFTAPTLAPFVVPPPPALDSTEYLEAFEQIRSFGARAGAVRSTNQTEVGIFWAYDRGGMGPPPILYNQVVQEIAKQQGNSLAENARLFAMVNLVQADAGIVCWAAKFKYNYWRPITGVQMADRDNNPLTTGDPSWEPLGAPGFPVRPDFTPPFPSYPSGHAIFGAAVFRVLRLFYGRDDISFSCGSDELPGVIRHYRNLSEADEENAMSRVYLGVHWIFDQRVGQVCGRDIADYSFANLLGPLPSSPALGLPLRLPDGSYALHVYAPLDAQWEVTASGDLRAWTPVTADRGPYTLLEPANSGLLRFFQIIARGP